ncbi:hypothetical protein ABW19_dt0200343 [Dactylella cylindrospora]|nr:hypothetical protein ABW19_dt0200343 [Dactylella cylindrospora]
MRNLIASRRFCYPINSLEAPDLPLSATDWDANSDSIICAFGPSSEFPVIELTRAKDGNLESITSWNYQGPCPKENLEVDRILNLHYFSDDGSICLVLEGGDVIVVREDAIGDQGRVEIVGSVDEGIIAAAWSPDEELLALATGANTFVLMTRQFEPVADTKLIEEDLKLSKHVNVGWGKKETQFKGKRQAALRDPTMPEKVDEGVLSNFDNKEAKLSWRGDGQYIALSTIQTGIRRVIRVFGRNGELDGVSEPVDGMEDTLSWRPSGNLIASIKRQEGLLEIIFFERNGLRHGEFPLRIPASDIGTTFVSNVSWNSDSTVLAVCLQDRIQLWTTMNYHWYLKWEISCEKPGGLACLPPRIKWHPEKALHLHVSSNGFVGYITELDFTWAIHRGATSAPLDFGNVAVIDGRILKLTPIRFANVPPPMSLHDVTLNHNIVDVTISSAGDSLVALTSGQLDLVAWDLPNLGRKAPVQLKSCIASLDPTGNYRQICFFGSDKVALLGDSIHGGSVIQVYAGYDKSWSLLDKIEGAQLPEAIAHIKTSGDGQSLLCQTLSGNILVFDETLTLVESINIPRAGLIEEFYSTADGKRIVVGLSEGGKLYVNEKLLANGCTSFVVTDTHIVLTTTQNFLKFVPLSTNLDEFQVPPDDSVGDERCRSIERGGKLVTVIPSTFGVVLQMPRGNLETIYPRALVLAGIRKSIDSKDYKTAFAHCRTHRVDLNLLHDHDPKQFMTSVDLFLQQVENVQYIDLFLSQLRDENVSKTMYNSNVWGASKVPSDEKLQSSNEIHDKVNNVCDAVLAGLLRRTSPSTQNLVTCYVSKKPADLDNGLRMISEMRIKDSENADLAIEHICFLADVNKLYDHALGIYDLELALLIAQQSQKDPREYLPFLQSIGEMEPLRQKVFINDFLGRHAKAATSLHEMGDAIFPELAEYTVKHDLYQHVTDLVKYDNEKRKVIVKLHAEYLLESSNYKEAGLAFEYLGSWDKALSAYQKCGMWQEALYTASRIPLSPQEITELSVVLAEALIESKDYRNAARIYLDYQDDVREAVTSFCKGSFFDEAMRVIALKQQFPLLDEVVDPGLVEAFNTTSELIADFLGQIKSQTSRIKELRKKKEEDPLAFYGTGGDTDAPDNVSVAGTNVSTAAGSIFTRYTDKTPGSVGTSATRKTSKNRRREERKKARGKKGSVYEEEYLVNSIGRLITRLNETQVESYRLIEGLIRRGMRERAESIQAGFRDVLAALEQGRKEVFETGEVVKPQEINTQEDQGDGAEIPSLIKPPDFTTLKKFEGLSIL